MTNDCISREKALFITNLTGAHETKKMLLELPAEAVRPIDEVDALVDKATIIINNYYTAMPYEVYCKILDAVEDIYSMNNQRKESRNETVD